MEVMVIVKATPNSEAGVSDPKMMSEMGKYNEELMAAGIVVTVGGLQPSSRGKRILIPSAGKRSVLDGPFAETKELVAGFWIWQVRDMDEAMEWARRCPHPMPGQETQLELRPIYGAEDLARFKAETAKEG